MAFLYSQNVIFLSRASENGRTQLKQENIFQSLVQCKKKKTKTKIITLPTTLKAIDLNLNNMMFIYIPISYV